jgi:hypothetical protein
MQKEHFFNPKMARLRLLKALTAISSRACIRDMDQAIADIGIARALPHHKGKDTSARLKHAGVRSIRSATTRAERATEAAMPTQPNAPEM